MVMQLKRLPAALLVTGLVGVGAASALSLNPADWFERNGSKSAASETAVAAAASPAEAAAAARSGPIAPLAAGSVPNYRAIVQQYGPTVVGVTVEGMRRATAEDEPDASDDPFFQFFRGLPGFGQQMPRGDVPFQGMGSGFIVSADGLILTNAHVVRDAKDVTVKLSDRREYRAKVLGSDAATDVAVLRINAKGLPVAQLGDPSRLQVGDPVLAIGAPYGLEQTATQGIVSAKGRSLPGESYVPFIQTDAAVNPGNSGGPLFDGSGAVVGINAQIYSRTGGYQGLAFAIPIDVAMKVKDQIVATGRANHARLGVSVQDLNQTLAESFGLPRPDGALVAGVSPDSAAAAAGLKSGDVITEVNGQPVLRSGDLSSRVGMLTPGERVKLKVWRDKSSREVDVKLARADDDGAKSASNEGAVQPGQLGLALRALSRDEARQAHVEQGLLVENAAGPAARAGVRPGDVLLSVNGKPVNTVEQVRGVMAQKPKSVALLIERDGDRIFVPIRLG